MGPLVLISLVTWASALALTAVVRAVAERWGIVDQPDGRRKLHRRPTPLWGGVAVYGAAVVGLLAIQFGMGDASPQFVALSSTWMIAAGCVCIVGAIDDRYDLPSRIKLLLQIVSVLPIVLFGYSIDRIVAFGQPIELGWLGIPLTVLWLVGCINALNLIDGMDGLASIVGLSTVAMTGVIAASQGHDHVAVMATVLAASLAGFLIYNLPPASVFLGDSGSMVIGLSVGLLGIQGTLKTSATLAITAPAVVMTLPMFDIVAAVVRRKLTGRRFDTPDRLHIHHRLLDRGWTPWQVLCLIGAVCLTTGAAATAATIFRRDALAWITAVTLVVLMIRLRLFGYEEFAMVKKAFIQFLTITAASIAQLFARRGKSAEPETAVGELPPLDMAGMPSLPPAALWDIFLRNVRAWDIHQVEFCAYQNSQLRRIRWINPTAEADEDYRWSLSVSLPEPNGEYCELRAARLTPIDDPNDLVVLTSLLKTFGAHFAAHAEQIFGPATVVEEPILTGTFFNDHLKAA